MEHAIGVESGEEYVGIDRVELLSAKIKQRKQDFRTTVSVCQRWKFKLDKLQFKLHRDHVAVICVYKAEL